LDAQDYLDEQRTVIEELSGSYSKEWVSTMQDEIESIMNLLPGQICGTYILVLKIKHKAGGSIERPYNTPLVAKGFTQI